MNLQTHFPFLLWNRNPLNFHPVGEIIDCRKNMDKSDWCQPLTFYGLAKSVLKPQKCNFCAPMFKSEPETIQLGKGGHPYMVMEFGLGLGSRQWHKLSQIGPLNIKLLSKWHSNLIGSWGGIGRHCSVVQVDEKMELPLLLGSILGFGFKYT